MVPEKFKLWKSVSIFSLKDSNRFCDLNWGGRCKEKTNFLSSAHLTLSSPLQYFGVNLHHNESIFLPQKAHNIKVYEVEI